MKKKLTTRQLGRHNQGPKQVCPKCGMVCRSLPRHTKRHHP